MDLNCSDRKAVKHRQEGSVEARSHSLGRDLSAKIKRVNYNDLTATSLEIIVNKGNHPQLALIQVSEFIVIYPVIVLLVVRVNSMNKCHKIRNYLNQNQPDLQEVVPRNNRLNQQNKLTRPGKRLH